MEGRRAGTSGGIGGLPRPARPLPGSDLMLWGREEDEDDDDGRGGGEAASRTLPPAFSEEFDPPPSDAVSLGSVSRSAPVACDGDRKSSALFGERKSLSARDGDRKSSALEGERSLLDLGVSRGLMGGWDSGRSIPMGDKWLLRGVRGPPSRCGGRWWWWWGGGGGPGMRPKGEKPTEEGGRKP